MSRGAEPCLGQALPAVLHALARQRRRQRRRRRPLHLRGDIEGLRAKVVAGEQQQAVSPEKWDFLKAHSTQVRLGESVRVQTVSVSVSPRPKGLQQFTVFVVGNKLHTNNIIPQNTQRVFF